MGYIYLRKNLSNGKKYIGQAVDIERRQREWNCLKREYAGKAINAARAKYGIDAFDFEIIKECEDEELNYWEMYYVKEYNSKAPYGYNMTDGGDSRCEITEETRKKIGDALRGRKRPDISAAKRGKPNPKISIAQRGKPKPKVSAALRGRKLSPEHVAKVAAARSKSVQALDKVTGEVVYEFPSAHEAQRQYGFDASSVSKCCRNCFNRPDNNVYKGFIWRYKCV